MKYFCLLVVLLFSQFTMGQISKTYISKDGKYSNDPKDASAYIVIQKLADTAYLLKEFGMNDTIIMKGIYKDSLLNVKNGKFYYYNKLTTGKTTANIYTNNYIQKSGAFNNDKPNGVWREYAADGRITKEYNFVNGKLNGLYKEFYNDYSGKWSEVTIVNDKYEGTHKTYNSDSLLIAEADYANNKMISVKLHLVEATPFDDFNRYLEKRLKKYESVLSKSFLFIKMTIDTGGHILSPQILPATTPEIDSAIKIVLLKAPPFNRAKYDHIAIEQKLCIPFSIFHEAENKEFSDRMNQMFIDYERQKNIEAINRVRH